MRKLTTRQKTLIAAFKRKCNARGETGLSVLPIIQYTGGFELLEDLEKLNDSEILFQEANRYFSDLEVSNEKKFPWQ